MGELKALYGLRTPSTNALKFLTWTTDVDVVTFSQSEGANYGEQRFYYTGDGAPKVSNYDLATTGSEPYPVANGYYDLGLPLPTTTLTALQFPLPLLHLRTLSEIQVTLRRLQLPLLMVYVRVIS